MMPDRLSGEEKDILLRLARESIAHAVEGRQPVLAELESLPPRLRQPGACFVTLTEEGQLRGCIGTLDAYQSLAHDVQEHAAGAATGDPRFFPVEKDEVERLRIEISRLSPPQPLMYSSPKDLLEKLRPGIDGVLLRDGGRRATFLPQVWEKIPNPREFLSQLCLKMGSPADAWIRRPLKVFVYQVEEFQEAADRTISTDPATGQRG